MALAKNKRKFKNMNNQKTILFVTPILNNFVLNDLGILTSEYKVIQNTYDWYRKYLTPFFLIHQFFFIAINIARINKIIIEFGGYWSLIPSLFGNLFDKKTIIICHGTDCASIPSLKYGSLGKKYINFFCKISYRLADLICPVSESLIKVENNFHINIKERKQGILNFFPSLNTPFKVIYNGLDIEFWKDNKYKKRKNTFVSVLSEKQYFLKGADLIYELAIKFKNYNFEIIGLEQPNFLDNVPENLTFSGKIKQKNLIKKYYQSEFYLQLSSFEGFGLSLCEAMLCNCIPIGSSVNMIPEIIGNNGYILKERDINKLFEIIKIATNSKNKNIMRKKARNSIIERFKLTSRKKILLHTLKNL